MSHSRPALRQGPSCDLARDPGRTCPLTESPLWGRGAVRPRGRRCGVWVPRGETPRHPDALQSPGPPGPRVRSTRLFWGPRRQAALPGASSERAALEGRVELLTPEVKGPTLWVPRLLAPRGFLLPCDSAPDCGWLSGQGVSTGVSGSAPAGYRCLCRCLGGGPVTAGPLPGSRRRPGPRGHPPPSPRTSCPHILLSRPPPAYQWFSKGGGDPTPTPGIGGDA